MSDTPAENYERGATHPDSPIRNGFCSKSLCIHFQARYGLFPLY